MNLTEEAKEKRDEAIVAAWEKTPIDVGTFHSFELGYLAGHAAALSSQWVRIEDGLPELHASQVNKWFEVTIEYFDDGQLDREVAMSDFSRDGWSIEKEDGGRYTVIAWTEKARPYQEETDAL